MTKSPVRGVGDPQVVEHLGVVAWIDRHATLTVFVVALMLLGVGFAGSLRDPPFWDAAWTSAAGAVELARSDMDVLTLLRQPEFIDAGPGTHSTSLVTLISGLALNATNPSTWIVLLHVANILIGAGLAAATFSLARPFVSRSLAVLTAGTTVSLPVVLQQIADPYLDLPLSLLTVLTVRAALRKQLPVAALSAFAAVAIKPAGLFLLAVLPFSLRDGLTKRRRRLVAAMALAASPIALFLVRQVGFQARPVLDDSPLSLLRLSAINVGLVPDLLAIVSAGALGAWALRKHAPELARTAGSLLGTFPVLYLAIVLVTRSIAFLPRYLITIVPIALVLLAADLSRRSSRVAHGVLVALLGISLVNATGTLYPLADHPHPIAAERSLAAQSYLQMEVAGTRALAGANVELLVADLHMYFRLAYPELGFVSDIPQLFTLSTEMPVTLPDSFAWITEPHSTVMDSKLTELAQTSGFAITRTVVHDDRWTSELVVARR